MNRSTIATSVLLITLGVGVPVVSIAQTPPATTYRPGFWQPVARVNPSQPVQMQLINRTDLPLDYMLTSAKVSQRLAPNGEINIPVSDYPAYLMVYPTVQRVNIQFKVTEKENMAVIEVIPTVPSQSQLSVTIDQTGAIYTN